MTTATQISVPAIPAPSVQRVIDNHVLNLTSNANPESYEVFDTQANLIARIELRCGCLTVKSARPELFPILYRVYPKGSASFDDTERDYWLTESVKSISKAESAYSDFCNSL